MDGTSLQLINWFSNECYGLLIPPSFLSTGDISFCRLSEDMNEQPKLLHECLFVKYTIFILSLYLVLHFSLDTRINILKNTFFLRIFPTMLPHNYHQTEHFDLQGLRIAEYQGHKSRNLKKDNIDTCTNLICK